ncbi:MAG: hypothetical protein H6742_09315 [Alphaproteobacteria bacterium]|nr:hypothetical protein [Alphaproteobacteria bacterium]
MTGPAVAVTGWGLLCALGEDPDAVLAALDAGRSGMVPVDYLRHLPDDHAAVVDHVDLRPWLKRRKDAKLLARPSQLLMPCAGRALGGFEGAGPLPPLLEVGAYVGVGREPPDDGDSEAALVASCVDGKLSEQALAGPGRDLYPPLLPLRTLPNMALAHVSIHLGVGGANGAWAGGPEAGLHALRAAVFGLVEGRTDAAVWGSTDSHSDLGHARDERRRGLLRRPGEGAGALRLERLGAAGARAVIRLVAAPTDPDAARAAAVAHHEALGACGAGDTGIAVLLAVARVASGQVPAVELGVGDPAVFVRIEAP